MIQYENNRSEKGDYIFFKHTLSLNFHAHLHRSFEYLSVERGALSLFVGGVRFHLEAGDRALILPRQIHSYECDSSRICLSRLCIFSVDYLPDFNRKCREGGLRSPLLIRGSGVPFMKLEEAQADYFLLKSRLYEIASAYMRGNLWTDAPQSIDAFAGEFLEYVEQHFSEPITLGKTAAALGYNYHYVSGLVNRCFGTTFPRMLNEYRISRACELLGEGERSITEISELCGFESIRSFNRNFKMLTGVTPGEYRQPSRTVTKGGQG